MHICSGHKYYYYYCTFITRLSTPWALTRYNYINLNTIFYTHVEDNPTKTINNLHKVLYTNTDTLTHTHSHTHWHTHTPHTHTHMTHTHTLAHTHTWHTHTHTHMTHTHTLSLSDCSRNWVLRLAGAEILRRERFSVWRLYWKDDRVEQCLRSCGTEFPNVGSRARDWTQISSCQHAHFHNGNRNYLAAKSEWKLVLRPSQPWPCHIRLGGETHQAYRNKINAKNRHTVVICGHCLVTLSITSYWNIKMALIAVHLNAGIILVVTV